MFTDTEIGLTLAHDAEVREIVRGAQGLIDSKNAQIAALQARLAAANATSADLIRERGIRNNEVLAARIAARRRH